MPSLTDFAKLHGLDPAVLVEARLQRDELRRCWTMPIYNRAGEAVGTWRRYDPGREGAALGSASGFYWCPSRFYVEGVVVVTSGMLNVLACASRGFSALGLTSDSPVSTATVYDLVRARTVLVTFSRPASKPVALKIAKHLAVFGHTRYDRVPLADFLKLDVEAIFDHAVGVRGRLLPDWSAA